MVPIVTLTYRGHRIAVQAHHDPVGEVCIHADVTGPICDLELRDAGSTFMALTMCSRSIDAAAGN